MATVSDEKTSTESEDIRHPNAEKVTSIATNFLRRLGHKNLKPKKVSVEEETYLVEVDLKKKTAKIRIDASTEEIKEYEIEAAAEGASFLPFSPKNILLNCGIVLLFLVIFILLDIQSLLKGMF